MNTQHQKTSLSRPTATTVIGPFNQPCISSTGNTVAVAEDLGIIFQMVDLMIEKFKLRFWLTLIQS